jgi:hypothetical protein
MKTIFTLRASLLLAFILAVSVQGHAQFTPGNIAVSELTYSGTTGSPVSISEYLPSTSTQATPVTSYALSQTSGSEFTGNGGTGGDGQISLSFDGRFITMGGYITPSTTLSAAGTPSLRTAARNIARIDAGGNVAYSTNTTVWGSGGLLRNVLSIDGGRVWGTASVGNTFLIDNSLASPADVASQTFTSSTTKRSATILKDNSGNYIMVEFDNTTSFKWAPIANDGTIAASTSVTYTTVAVINYGIAFVDVDPVKGWNNTPYDVLYVCNTGGIFKFSWDPTANAGAGGWIQNNATVYQATVTGGVQNGYCGIVAYKNSNNKVTLNLITGNGSNNALNQLITWEDNGWGVAPAATPGSIVKLATAGTGKIFKGISMAPSETWTGATNTAYETSTNWKAGVIPATTRPIYVPTGLTNYPVVNADNTTKGAFIESGAKLTVAEGKVLTNTGTITNNGDLILKSSAAGTASLLSTATVPNVTQQRYLSSNQRGWRLLSNPLATTTFNTLAAASNITLGTNFTGAYDSATNTWTSTDGTATMAAQQAYKVFVTGLTGEAPNYTTGPSNVTLANKGTAANTVPTAIVTTAGQFYLVANPYTAPVSVSSIIVASTSLSTTVSYYNPNIGSTDVKLKFGGYDTPTVSGVAGSATDVVIPPMGAIFVQASSAGTINVPKTAIFTGTPLQAGTYTHKTAQAKVASTNALKVEVSSNGIYYDTVILQFKALGDAGSNIDFGKLPNSILDAYSIAGTQKMAVSELELAAQTIPLGITSTIQKSYTFKVVENTIPAGFEAVLVDNVQNTNTVLVPGTNYNFAIDSTPASQGDARFAINLRTAGSLGVKTNELDAKIQVYPNPSRGQFNISNTLEDAANIEISSLNGQVIHTQKLNSGTTTIQTKSWATGVYILKASSNGTETTKKLIIQ